MRLEGSNNNIFDVENGILVPTSLVTVISGNSAGLILNAQSSLQPGDITDIADAVWDEAAADHTTSGTFGQLMSKFLTVGKWLGLRGGPGK